MTYILEPYYFNDNNFPARKAELIVAATLSQWAKSYEARLIAPKTGTRKERREGEFDGDTEARQYQATKLLKRLQTYSIVSDLFYLKMWTEKPQSGYEAALFDHHDTSASWVLNLTGEQFAKLQKALKDNDLPIDLFYPEEKMICQPAKWLGIIPYQHCYSPKQWEQANKNNA